MSDPATPTERLYAIAEQGLCIGCGLCQAVAGSETIGVTKTRIGELRPIVVGDLSHETVDTIYDVCPGTRVDGLPERLIETDTKLDNVWGPWRRIVRAWAGDPEVRHVGATGGVLTALGQYLLTSGRVSFVLHAKASISEPAFGERVLSFTDTDVFDAAGSRYGPTAPLIDVKDVLDRAEPFAFIGKPCDIDALRNWARHDGRVDELVKYWLTPVCGGYMPTAGMLGFLDRIDIDPDDVTSLRYRGYGCPGPTRVETADSVTDVHYLDMWGEDASQWLLPWRCKVCPDGIGEGADIAASDSWIGGSPTREESETDPGTNAVIARTVVGQELLEAAVAEGALVVEHDVTPDDMSIYQPHQMRKKYAVASRYEGLKSMGRIAPVTNRLRIEELAAEVPLEVRRRESDGTIQRVGAGKATEPQPSLP
jgi:coenzyme F420 hydrogenase subunit beta